MARTSKTPPRATKQPAARKAPPNSAKGAQITPELVAAHGLKPDEYQRVLDLIGREPSITELGIFSAMWNEHCSYKSSKIHLRTLPTQAPWVIQGPGENAGVIDIGDGLAVVFKMESHNHPSYIEPYQGAATGVGGILRDVFTMGARPIACLNALSFGAPAHPETRHLVSGVVAGIGGYGNSFGVPTVGGSVRFHTRYDGNCLVNAMAVGLAPSDKIFYAAASGVGMPIVYLGSKTGRDGIHGATMASAEFGEDAEEKRPTVQVGDPFAEKLLLEACLEIMANDCVIAIQDMGAAGLTCSAVEMGAKGDLGVTLDLDRVPCRETGMSAYEMMLSESQERMLMVLKPEKEREAEAIFRKWGLDFAVVGETTPTKRFIVRHRGEVVADLPIKELGDEAPVYDRPHADAPKAAMLKAADVAPPMATADALLRLIGSPDLCSKRWVWEQYDHVILGNTVQRPGGDAAVVRVVDGPKALALTCDVTPRYCEADPFEGGKQAVAEAWRNLAAVGARAAGRHRQSQFRQSGAAGDHGPAGRRDPRHRRGLHAARIPGRVGQCLALQRDQRPRDPADAHHRRCWPARRFHQVGDARLQGRGRSHFAYRRDHRLARPVAVSARDLRARRRRAAAGRPGRRARGRRSRARAHCRRYCRRRSMMSPTAASWSRLPRWRWRPASAPSSIAHRLAAHAFWFGEDQGRYVVTVDAGVAEKVMMRAPRRRHIRAADRPHRRRCIDVAGRAPHPGRKLRERFEGWLPRYMAGGPA